MSPPGPDARGASLPQWPNACGVSGATATLKRFNADFRVTELPLQSPSGEGAHLWLEVEKNGANTVFVAQQPAQAAGVQEHDGATPASRTATPSRASGSAATVRRARHPT